MHVDGDLALIRGFSVLTGQPVYAIAGEAIGRSRVDVDAYTGKTIPEADLKKLRAKKAELEAADAAKSQDLFGSSDTAKSASVPKPLFQLFNELKKVLNLNSRIYLTTVEDARRDRSSFSGAYRAIGSVGLDPKEAGVVRRLPNGDYYIAYQETNDPQHDVEVLAHELGHIHEREMFIHADANTKLAVRTAYNKWLGSLKGKSAKEHVVSMRSMAVGKATKVPEGLSSEELNPYWHGFNEWYADQVSRWATTDKAPLGLVERFFKKVADGIKKMLSTAFGKDFLATKEMTDWLSQHPQIVKDVTAPVDFKPQQLISKAEPKLTAAGEKAKKLVEAMKGIANEKPKQVQMSTMKKVGAFFMDPSYRVGLERAFRVQVVSKTASVEDKFRTLFNGAIRDSLGEVRPDLFIYQADHSDNIAVQVMKFGKLVLTKGLGWEAKDGKASMQGVIDRIKALGVKLREQNIGDQELAFTLANGAFIAKRANDVRGKGIIDDGFLPDPTAVAAGLKAFKEFPELEEAFKEWTDFKNGLVDAMVEGGRITPEQAKSWKDAIGYVPWNRIKDYEAEAANSPQGHFKGLVNLRGIKPLKGGKDEINSIFDNMVGLSFWMTNSAVRNHAALKTTDAFLDNNLGVRRVRPGQSGVDPNKVVIIYRKGIPESYEYEDPLDLYAFKGIESLGGPFLTAFTNMSNFLRKATTATPQFALSQLFQDGGFRAILFSGVDNPFSLPAKVIRGFIKEAGDDPLTKKINMLGIAGAVDMMPGRAQETIEKAFGIKQYTTMDKILSKMESFSIASDTALRKAVFQQTLDETKSKEFPEGDVLLARFRAQEIINFKRQGASKVVGVLRQMVPFMNAYIQGMDVLYRTMTGRGIAAKERQVAFGMFLQAGTKLAAMSTIYAMLVSGDDEYEGLRDYDKNKHFIFPGTGMKMPVAPEVGLLFKVIPERLYGYLISQSTDRPKDATELRKAIANAAFDALSGPNLTPQAVKPILEVYMNHSFFTNAPVVGRGMEYMAPNMQFTDATAELAKLLSNTAEQAGVELSPMKLEYLFRGFTGIAGGALLDISNSMFGDRPDKRLYEQPFAKTFMYDKVPGGYKEGYYAFRESINEVTTTVNALKAAGRADELVDYLEGDQKLTLYALRSTINKVDDQLGDIRNFKKIIAADPNMSGKDKKDAIEELEEAENDMVKAYNIPYLRKRIAGM